MADVKAEIKPEIKLDPAEPGERKLADLDEFEDDVDLQIPPTDTPAWLVKVPKEMWQAWNAIYKDAPEDEIIELGKMRVYHSTNPTDADDMTKQRLQIRLHADKPQHAQIPLNYDLKVTTKGYSNTVVFSEKDLPGHRTHPFGRSRYGQANKPSGIPSKADRYGAGNLKAKPTYRTAIPKQTALAPMIHHEALATPVEDAAYDAYIKRQWDAHIAPKHHTTYIEGVDRAMHPGTSGLANFSAFGSMSARPGAAGARKKLVKEKNVRMERGQLMDALQRCFRRYRYWSMKALRNELRQPEAWIKELLETIATLVRSGDFAMNWVLKPEYQSVVKESDDVKNEVANVESGTDGASGDEMEGDEGDDDFEDIKMGGS